MTLASELRSKLKTLGLCLGLTAAYIVSGKLGLQLAVIHPSATPVWPPTGIAFAALLLLGYRVWPGVLLGAFLVNLTTAGTAATSLGIAVGNTLEAVVGVWMVNRFAHGRKVFEREQDILRFALLAGMGSTMVAATFGATSLALGRIADWRNFGPIWLSWWLGDMTGNLVVAPLAVLWSTRSLTGWRPRDSEAAILLLCLLLIGVTVFGGLLPLSLTLYPLFFCIPFLLWAAFRFTQRQAATATAMLSTIAIWGTLRGFGPFVRSSPLDSLLLLQAFTGFMSVMTLAMAALVAERRRIEEDLRKLAVSDSLTGLVNHRRFLEVLHEEIRRSQRTERPFAVVLLDLDGLKRVNDSLGHLVGSRALCRLADILRATCRATDTAARFGGDEFAMILVETGSSAATLAARRVREQLASEPEQPHLTVSAGVAVFPEDGPSVESLLQAADRALYQMKATHPPNS